MERNVGKKCWKEMLERNVGKKFAESSDLRF